MLAKWSAWDGCTSAAVYDRRLYQSSSNLLKLGLAARSLNRALARAQCCLLSSPQGTSCICSPGNDVCFGLGDYLFTKPSLLAAVSDHGSGIRDSRWNNSFQVVT